MVTEPAVSVALTADPPSMETFTVPEGVGSRELGAARAMVRLSGWPQATVAAGRAARVMAGVTRPAETVSELEELEAKFASPE